jgi:indole-3-glycerol phosphate synthase
VILDEILQHKRGEVNDQRQTVPLAMLQDRIAQRAKPCGFGAALRQQSAVGTAIIAEVKKGSPSKGIIRADFDPCDIARRYQAGGATCLSVLTDQRFFMGSLAYLEAIAEIVSLPLLRKDFVVDSYQIYEARAAGADAVLLIAAALSQDALTELVAVATDLNLDVLLEVHNEEELERALRLPVELIGINNRDLKTFHTDLAVTERLLPLIPADRLVVSESGLRCRADIRRLQQAGAGAFLIGESLMREADFEKKLQELLHDQF